MDAPTQESQHGEEAHLRHDRIMQASRLATVGEMATGVAHELNQPLAAISNYAQACVRLLDRGEYDKADLRSAMQEIIAQTARAAEIIRRLRSLARNTNNERAATSVNNLVNDLLELLHMEARVHSAQLSFEQEEGLPDVMVDRIQIQHVVFNLVRNAFEAFNAAAASVRQVTIRTARVSTLEIEIAVYDTGPGVPDRVAERMFEPFFTTKGSGTGLGLAVSQTVMHAHGGSLGYRPNAPAGACFFLRIPIATEYRS